MTGSVLTIAFMAVSVSIDDERADRENRRTESLALQLLVAQSDELPDLDLSALELGRMYAPNKNLSGSNFRGSRLAHVNFRGTNLRESDFGTASLAAVDLREADLTGARLFFASLTGTDMRGAVLREADLTGASLDFVDLRGAILEGADLSGTDYVANICHDSTTLWPTDYAPPASDCSFQDSLDE